MELMEKEMFSLHHNSGDDWMFTIIVQNIQEDSKTMEPHIVNGIMLEISILRKNWKVNNKSEKESG